MISADLDSYHPSNKIEYLCVDEFIQSIIDARALKSAFELRLIDHLQAKSSTFDELAGRFECDGLGLGLLLDLLLANQVIDQHEGEFRLGQRFLVALRYRDLLEAKLDFANLVSSDFVQLFTSLIVDPGKFMRDAKLFELFDYGRCFDDSSESYERTKRWVRFATILTRYEALACLPYHEFGRHQQMLDIGGNSGEFALQICKQCPSLRATVFDLPVVCRIGREHVASEPEADRIVFVAGNALQQPLPTGFDLLTFKSMLHDWPQDAAKQFIRRASESLAPGGTLLIFERSAINVGGKPLPYSLLPMLLFFRSFRSPQFYSEFLEEMGFDDISVQTVNLEMPFFLLTAKKPG
jgi:ubiquinone/menaquinone biosynthesis C-methylase UbiE